MAFHPENMQEVAEFGQRPDEGPFRVRVSQVEEKNSTNSGEPIVEITMKIQDEGKFFGQELKSWPSLQPAYLSNLKRFYRAIGYEPGPEGHDTDKLLDGEFFVYVKHKDYVDKKDGQKKQGSDLPNWGIRTLAEGPAQARS